MTNLRSIVGPIMRLAFSIEKVADRKLRRDLGLGVSQFRMLMVIRRGVAVRQRDIAEYWGVAEASVSRQIETLREKGFVAHRRAQKNRREHTLELTPRGLALVERALAAMESELDGFVSAVPARRRAGLASGLRTLLAAFQESCGDPAHGRHHDEKRTGKHGETH